VIRILLPVRGKVPADFAVVDIAAGPVAVPAPLAVPAPVAAPLMVVELPVSAVLLLG